MDINNALETIDHAANKDDRSIIEQIQRKLMA